MIRRLFTIASVVSLLLCVSVTALRARSYWVRDIVRLYHTPNEWVLSSQRSNLWFMWWSGERRVEQRSGLYWERTDPADSRFTAFGFQSDHSYPWPGTRGPRVSSVAREVWFPYWAAFAATGLLPSMAIIDRIRERTRRRVGLCRCGYDLRASRGRCPECGTPIPAGAKT